MHTTIASRWNADLVDRNFEVWLSKPDSLDPEWRAFFEGFELAQNGNSHHAVKSDDSSSREIASKQARAIGAIYAFRSIGHTIADFNPLIKEAPFNPRLTLERLGFDESDLNKVFHTGNYLNGVEMTMQELLDRLKKTYCSTIGVEYLHIQETPRRRWLQARIEPECFVPRFTKEQKERILRTILHAEDFENFLQTRYVGQKRFSLEGGETLIACLESIFERCSKNKVDEIVMGMAHRGRLNVLANFLGKPLDFIFREFSEHYIPENAYGDGDVKYHLGFITKRTATDGHEVEVEHHLDGSHKHLERVAGEGTHALDPPLLVRAEHDLGVRVRREPELRLQLLAQLDVVVDLAVVGQRDRLVVVEDRLRAELGIDDREAPVREPDLVAARRAGAVRPSMNDRVVHPLEFVRIDGFAV